MTLGSTGQRGTVLVRIDANYEPVPGYRDQATIVARICSVIQTLPNVDRIVLIGNRGRPVIAPRDSFQRIRDNNPQLQFGELAQALAVALGSTKPVTMIAMSTVQIPAYQVSERVVLLENLAFDLRESANDKVLARQLAAIGERYYIDDFRALNDSSASIVSIPKAVPSAVSSLVEHQLSLLDRSALSPNHPFVVVIGGSQVSRKLRLIQRLANVADELLVGGVVANTFLVARGVDLQRSLVEGAQVDTAKQLDGLIGTKLILPTDFVWRAGRVMDIGPNTRTRFTRSLAQAATILFAGPVGVTSPQLEAFRFGSLAIAEAIADNKHATKLILGDDTVALVNSLENPSDIVACEGDAASIDYLSGIKLAGLEAIRQSRYTVQRIQNSESGI